MVFTITNREGEEILLDIDSVKSKEKLEEFLKENGHDSKQIEIYEKCIEKWGKNPQLDQLNEEILELIQELSKIGQKINHIKRGRIDPEFLESKQMNDLVGEIVDVEIMLYQLKLMFHLDLPIRRVKLAKLRRLKKRLE
jgi:hypothetical protein